MEDCSEKIVSNTEIEKFSPEEAKIIIEGLQEELKTYIQNGFGPFLAAIYDENNNLVAKAANSVELNSCSNCHAEINAIKLAEEKLKTYDLSSYNLKIYITSEPCIMCLGAIMWSGIKEVYYGVPSSLVEKITGFDEGYKPNWLFEFKKRGIKVYGNISPKLGAEVLLQYKAEGRKIYKPERE